MFSIYRILRIFIGWILRTVHVPVSYKNSESATFPGRTVEGLDGPPRLNQWSGLRVHALSQVWRTTLELCYGGVQDSELHLGLVERHFPLMPVLVAVCGDVLVELRLNCVKASERVQPSLWWITVQRTEWISYPRLWGVVVKQSATQHYRALQPRCVCLD